MDARIRRLVVRAALLGLVCGALVAVLSGGGVYEVVVGGVLGAAVGPAAVLYWGEHGGARRAERRERRAAARERHLPPSAGPLAEGPSAGSRDREAPRRSGRGRS